MGFRCENCGKKVIGRRIRRFCDRTCQEKFDNAKIVGAEQYIETNIAVPKEEEIVFPTPSKKKPTVRRKSKKDDKSRDSDGIES